MSTSDGEVSVRIWLRWTTTIGLFLAGLAMALPAVSFRIDFTDKAGGYVEATFSGLDPALNGWAQISGRHRDESGRWREQQAVQPFLSRAEPSAQATGLLTLVVLALGVAAATLRERLRAGVALGAAVLAGLTVTASMIWTKAAMGAQTAELVGPTSLPAGHVHFRYGFWLVLSLLTGTAAANALAVLARPAAPTATMSKPPSAWHSALPTMLTTGSAH